MAKKQKPLKTNQKERLRKGAIQGSRYYNRYLLDKIFAIILEDYTIQTITFRKEDFLHLSGLSVLKLNSKQFFDICTTGTLANYNIKDIQHYNYKTLLEKNDNLMKLNKFLHADASTNLFVSGLITNTFVFPCAIRNDKENIAICFLDTDNHARSLRKAKNSHNFSEEKQILAIFEVANNKMEKCIYIRNKQQVIENIPHSNFSDNLKEFLNIFPN